MMTYSAAISTSVPKWEKNWPSSEAKNLPGGCGTILASELSHGWPYAGTGMGYDNLWAEISSGTITLSCLTTITSVTSLTMPGLKAAGGIMLAFTHAVDRVKRPNDTRSPHKTGLHGEHRDV